MTLRAVSLRSLKSARSELTRSEISTPLVDAPQLNFDEFIGTTCKRFNCPISVTVGKEIQKDIVAKGGKKYESKSRFKRKSVIPQLQDMGASDEDTKTATSQVVDTHTLLVMTYYDFMNRLTEIHMAKFRYQPIPRILMQLIALIAPFNKHLNKFTIKFCKIDMYTIYELSKILPVTNITELCLDHSPLRQGNYDILLCESSCLRTLSLARCNINDIICERIAARLHFLEPAEHTLVTLNLSTNYITDVGAEHLGEALRTNRHLRYLNLAGNQITDKGVSHIFQVLTEFPLTAEEVIEKRRRYANYLNKRNALYQRCMYEFKPDDNGSIKKSSKKPTTAKNRTSMKREKVKDTSMTDEVFKEKLELMVLDLLGPFRDPYGPELTKVRDKHTYCVGNLVLCYLNLAYNSLSFVSIQKLRSILLYQQRVKSAHHCGLLNVLVDGNYLPEECKELDDINNILLKHIICFGSHSLFEKNYSKRKSTVTISKQPLYSG